jgi:predicted membrane protein
VNQQIASGRLTGRVVAGVLLLILGLLFTLDNFGVVNAGDLFHYWPLILVGVGIVRVIDPRRESRVTGVVLILLGGVFLLRTLDLVRFRFGDLWPFALLLIGGLLVWQSIRGRRFLSSPPSSLDSAATTQTPREIGGPSTLQPAANRAAVLNEFVVMAGADRVIHSDFRGGEVSAIMGGIKVDLRDADMTAETATIEVFVLMGGIEIYVPDTWRVVTQGFPLLGGFVDTTHSVLPAGATPKILVVRGTAIMGGVEVKN